MLEGVWRKGTLLHCWWECKLVQPLWRTVWRYFRKLYIEIPYDPAIPLLGIYPDKTFLEKDTCTCVFIAALFTMAKTWKQPKCPSTDEWIKKMWYRGVPVVAQWLTNPTRNHEFSGLVPGLAQWVKSGIAMSCGVACRRS